VTRAPDLWSNAEELRLSGRRAFCKSIADIAPAMQKTVKLRILDHCLESVKDVGRHRALFSGGTTTCKPVAGAGKRPAT